MSRVTIIAEAGVNHNGSLALAHQLIEHAAVAEADFVKFQTFISSLNISSVAKKAQYQLKRTASEESQLEMVKKLELSFSDFKVLSEFCKKKHIEFLSTPFDLPSLHFLVDELNMQTIKVPSGEVSNLPFLVEVGRKRKKVILSTGMTYLGEVELALAALLYGRLHLQDQPSRESLLNILARDDAYELLSEFVTILHCTTEYPAPLESINLNAMKTVQSAFNLPIGYSDHTEGIHISIAAVALGAVVVEKHFTTNKEMPGPDHKSSLEPAELKDLVRACHAVALALGTGRKVVHKAELANRSVARKVVVAARDIEMDHIFASSDLIIKRSGSGLEPARLWELVGTKANKRYSVDEPI